MEWTGERVVPDKMTDNDLIEIYREHLARYAFVLPLLQNKKVLDAACGSGYGSELMATQASLVWGVDISVEAIEYAKNKYRKPIFKCVDISNGLDGVVGDVDVVVSFETIEHLLDPHNFLQDIANRVREYFVFSIPIENDNEFHQQVYSVKEAKSLMESYFEDIEWYDQVGSCIRTHINGGDFIIGIAKIKPQC